MHTLQGLLNRESLLGGKKHYPSSVRGGVFDPYYAPGFRVSPDVCEYWLLADIVDFD